MRTWSGTGREDAKEREEQGGGGGGGGDGKTGERQLFGHGGGRKRVLARDTFRKSKKRRRGGKSKHDDGWNKGSQAVRIFAEHTEERMRECFLMKAEKIVES
eukprot:746230-Hanusia_phi.AAC.2